MTSRTDTTEVTWRTSSYSTGGNQCVEVTVLPTGEVVVRDSKAPHVGAHVFSRPAWNGFVRTIKKNQI
jgi:hypothetical protein